MPGSHLQVVGMSQVEEWIEHTTVRVIDGQKSLLVFLGRLEPVGCDELTTQVLTDWLYWLDRGYFDAARQPLHLSGLTREA